MLNEILLHEAQECAEEFIQVRRLVHSHAEVGMELPYTAKLICEKLREYGYEPRMCGKGGVVAVVGEGGGDSALLRADMDGLPIKEETELPFACENGNMHACGHDMHTAMLLCAAKLLKRHESELKGKVKIMFQPGEELLSGADDMIKNGALEDPSVFAAFSLHVLSGSPLKSGAVILPRTGVSAPAADNFEIRVSGKGCHGASPWNGADALLAAAHIVSLLCQIPARELAPKEGGVVTVGKMTAGGAANTVAGMALLEGTARALSASSRERIKRRITEIAFGAASAFRAKAEVRFTSGCPPLVNHGAVLDAVSGYARELLGCESVLPSGDGGGGSEDFAFVSEKVPSVMVSLAAGDGEYPMHHPKVRFDEGAIPIGGALYAYIAARLLEDREKLPLDLKKSPDA